MKVIISILLSILIIVIISVFGTVLYVKLVANTVSDVQLYKQTISFGLIIFTLLLSGTYAAIKYVDIYRDKQLDSYLGKSELLRVIHNEIKRYNGDESMFLAHDENLILLMSEIASLYEIAKLQQQRKAMTSPSGKQFKRSIDMNSIVNQLKGELNLLDENVKKVEK